MAFYENFFRDFSIFSGNAVSHQKVKTKRAEFEKHCKMGAKAKKGGSKVRKTEIVFDESKRRDFLTGFRKRKQERRKKAQEQIEKTLKEEIRLAK